MNLLQKPFEAKGFKTLRVAFVSLTSPTLDCVQVSGLKDGKFTTFKNSATGYTSSGFFCYDIDIELDFITSILFYSPNGGTNYNLEGSFSIILGNGTGANFIGSFLLKEALICILSSSDEFEITNNFNVTSAFKGNLPSSYVGTTGFKLDAVSTRPYLITKATFTLTTGAGTTSIVLCVKETSGATALPINAHTFTVSASSTYYVTISTDVNSNFIAGPLIGLALKEPLYNANLDTFFGIEAPGAGDSLTAKALYGLGFQNRNFYKLGLNQ